MCQPQFPKCLLSYCLTKQAFWSLTAAKPVLGPSSPQHNLQPLSVHPTALTGDRCDLPGPPMLPTCLQERLFPNKDLAVKLFQQNLKYPKSELHPLHLLRVYKGLATTDLQHYLLFLCGHPSAGTGSFEQLSQAQSTTDGF